jgi:hypothetical protein
MASLARRNRLATGAFVAGFLLATHALWPDPQARVERQYLFVITLGYGHLIGAAVFSRQRLARLMPAGVSSRLFELFVVASVLDLFALYAWLSNVSLAFFLPLLAVSLWHIVENDLALGRAYGERLALDGLPRSPDHHLAAFGMTALLLAFGQSMLALASYAPEPAGLPLVAMGNLTARIAGAACGVALVARRQRRLGLALAAASVVLPAGLSRFPGFGFGDFFSSVTLYHLVQFLVFFADRACTLRQHAARRRLWRRIAWVHLSPALLCAALLLPPGDHFGALRYAIFSPQIYLFWSVLHVAQTIAARGIERRAAPAPQAVRA